jgi:hypothetical protein
MNSSKIALRTMFEDYLTSQLQGVRIPVEGDRHCWMVKEERLEVKNIYDWMGKKLGTQSGVVVSIRYIWLGSKGSVIITKEPTFNRKKHIDSEIHLNMKRWVWQKYFNITL